MCNSCAFSWGTIHTAQTDQASLIVFAFTYHFCLELTSSSLRFSSGVDYITVQCSHPAVLWKSTTCSLFQDLSW